MMFNMHISLYKRRWKWNQKDMSKHCCEKFNISEINFHTNSTCSLNRCVTKVQQGRRAFKSSGHTQVYVITVKYKRLPFHRQGLS